MSNEQSETNRRSAGDKKGPSTNGSGSNADGGFGQPHFTPDFSTGWRNTMQQQGASSQQGGPIDHAYNNYFYPGAGYSPFSGDIRDSIAAIWSRTSPSGEGVAAAFSGGYGQFPDSSAGQFAANSTPAGQFNQSPAGTFAANLTGHFAAQSELSMFGAAPTGGDYSPYAAAAASAGYNYGAQYTQWPDSSAGRGAYSYLGAGGIQDQDSVRRGDRVGEIQAGMEGMKLQSGQRKETNGYSSGGGGGQPKKMSWANVASQPAKPQAPPQKVKKPGVLSPPAIISSPKAPVPTEPPTKEQQQPMVSTPQQPMPPPPQQQPPPMQQQGPPPMQQGGPPRGSGPSNQGPRQARGVGGHGGNSGNNQSEGMKGGKAHSHPVLDNLRSVNDYNPRNFDLSPKNARFFVIKSFSEDDIHRSIKYEIWCSTDHGNKRLDAAFKERQGKGPIYLFFSVNGSGHFCGMAQMLSGVDYSNTNCVWVQDKFKGQFKVKWVYVKDVPNGQLRHIRLENNENKPVTNSRDTQEVPPEKGKLVLKIIHGFKHSTSIFDDFIHYEKRQEEEEGRKQQQQKMGDEPKIPDGRGDGGPRAQRQPRNDRPKN